MWNGIELLFHGGKRVGKEGETLAAGWIPCCRCSVSGPDVAETGAGCGGPVPPMPAQIQEFVPEKRDPRLHNHQPARSSEPTEQKLGEKGGFSNPCAAALSFPRPGPAVALGFLSLAPNLLPAGFSCWEVVVCWEMKHLEETFGLCWDFQGGIRGAGSLCSACREFGCAVSSLSPRNILGFGENKWIPGALRLAPGSEKAGIVGFPRNGLHLLCPGMRGVFVTASHLFFGAN